MISGVHPAVYSWPHISPGGDEGVYRRSAAPPLPPGILLHRGRRQRLYIQGQATGGKSTPERCISVTSVHLSIPVKSPVFNRSLLFFGLHFTCLLFFSCFFLVSCFSPVFLENQSKATIISCFSSSSAQIYSYSLACNSALLACLNSTQLT